MCYDILFLWVQNVFFLLNLLLYCGVSAYYFVSIQVKQFQIFLLLCD
jgi:hypothetical protein